MNRFIRFIYIPFALIGASLASYGAVSSGLSIVSGNGQVLYEYLPTTVPLVVQALDAQGKPAAGISVTWSITQGQGTLIGATTTTDSSGLASTSFTASGLMAGYSFTQQVVTASSPLGTASFHLTTSVLRLPNGQGALPIAPLLAPDVGQVLSGQQGSVLPGAVRVQVIAASGSQQGSPVPFVGLRIFNGQDPKAPAPATCANTDGGVVLTDASGNASCDLKLTGAPGHYWLSANVGEYLNTRVFELEIKPGAACSFTLSSLSQAFAANVGTGSVSVTSSTGCSWTASSNAPWLTITSGNAGTGNGTVTYAVGANTGAARTGAITIGGQTLTITQQAPGSAGAPKITTAATLPTATAGLTYALTLGATGGQPPYTWALNSGSIPAGLTFAPATGVISGVPSTAGTYTFQALVRDSAGLSSTQNFTLVVQPAGSGGTGTNPAITVASFPNAAVGAAYQQTLTWTGGCSTPFSPPPDFSVYSGALPPGLAINMINGRDSAVTGTPTQAGTYSFTLMITDVCGRTGKQSYSMVVSTGQSGNSPVSASPASVQFSYHGTALTDQTVSLSSASPLGFSASVNPGTGGNWLTIAGASAGSTPASVVLHPINYSALPVGTYTASLVIAPAGGTPLTVPVTLAVGAASGRISVTPTSLDVTVQAKSGTASITNQALNVQTDGGSVTYSAAVLAVVNGGNWLSISKPTGTAPDTLTVKIDATNLEPGTYTAYVGVTGSGQGAQTQQIRVTVQAVPPPSFVLPSGLTFAVSAGGPAPNAQPVLIGSSSLTIPFTVVSNADWLHATPDQAVTPADISVSADPTGLEPGTYKGEITVTSTNPGSTPAKLPVMLVVAGTQPSVSAVVNGASFALGAIAPGELVTLFGSNLGPTTLTTYTLDSVGLIKTELAGTEVRFDGQPAPVWYTRNDQVTVIAPFGLVGKTSTDIEVRYQNQTSAKMSMPVAAAAPAIFLVPPTTNAAALNQDLSVNTEENGAAPGDTVALYLTGAGQMVPGGIEGSFVHDDSYRIEQRVTAKVNDIPAEVVYAGGAPMAPAGAYQINVKLPDSLPAGVPATISITVGEATTQSGVTIFIRKKP